MFATYSAKAPSPQTPAASLGGLASPAAISRRLAFVLLCLLAVVPAFGQELVLNGDASGSISLEVGGNLEVGLQLADSKEDYVVYLVDEGGDVVTRLRTETDAWGQAPSTMLWPLTGVEGCDPGAVHDPLSYRFQSFGEARSILNGRSFRVVLVEDLDLGPEEAIAEAKVNFFANLPLIEAFASDGAGCFRTFLELEPLHLSIRQLSGAAKPFLAYVVQAQDSWAPGDAMVDVRGAPQLIVVPHGVFPTVEFLWMPTFSGNFQIFLRQAPAEEDVFDPAIDILLENGVELVGSTVNECGVCPPP